MGFLKDRPHHRLVLLTVALAALPIAARAAGSNDPWAASGLPGNPFDLSAPKSAKDPTPAPAAKEPANGAVGGKSTGPELKAPAKPATNKIEELRWTQNEIRVDEDGKYFALVHGIYPRKEWKLIWRDEVMERSENGEFVLLFEKTSDRFTIDIRSIGPGGEVENEKVVLDFSMLKPKALSKSPTRQASKHMFTPAMGVTYMSYQEIGTPGFSQIAMTPKLTYGRGLPWKNWDFGANIFFNSMGFMRSRPDVSVSFLGVNVRVGYTFARIAAPWRFTLMVGPYLSTMMVAGASFGYTPIVYPQIYPVLRRVLSSGDQIYGTLKYVPMNRGFGVFSTTEYELAGGVGWIQRTQDGHPFSFSLDVSRQAFVLSPGQDSEMLSVTFGVGYGL